MKMEAMRNAVEANLVSEGKASNIFDFNKTAREAADLFDELKYSYGSESDNNIATKLFPMWWNAKKNLRSILRKHTRWDERQQVIIYDSSYDTGIDMAHIKEACYWFAKQIGKKNAERKVQFDEERYLFVRERYIAARDITLYNRNRINDDLYEAAVRQRYEYKEEYVRLTDYFNTLTKYTFDEEEFYMLYTDYTELRKVFEFFNYYSYDSNVADEDFARKVNNLGDFRAVAGQKVSRIINKICKHYGIDKVKDMKEVVRHAGSDHEVREMKDYGFNYYMAMLGDAVNPLHITKYTVISINPMDYWTMSFFKNTASCHTIDKLNVRDVYDSEHVYNGMYSAGTESYMLDNSSVVFYTVDADYKGDMWKADKDRRMMFHIGEDGKHFIFGRLYPDGRDGGETGLAAQFRNVMQKVLSECLGFNNLWKVKKGVSGCEDYSCTEGTHYADYLSYDDCGYSHLSETEMRTINIGHNPICPYCGDTHRGKESVFCYHHNSMEEPEREDVIASCCNCDGTIYEDDWDRIYCEDNDEYYCCESCARNDGLRLCEDDENWHTDWWADSYTGAYYSQDYYDNSDEWISGDGVWFANRENMENAGYVEVDGDAYRSEEAFWDNYDEQWYLTNDYDYIVIEYEYRFRDEENARNYGFELNENGEWVRA